MKTTPASMLQLQRIELLVHLGWEESERAQPQTVYVDIEIHYPATPKACHTDDLADTVCYAALIEDLQQFTSQQTFRLIEHLCFAIYQRVESQLSPNYAIRISVTKYPQIAGLVGGATFSYSNHKQQ
ncbi:MAG TPA: dihydroneopterin aldolase [Gammaproteobacteria bacterium]|jgi:FolB domain-containing protein|nr:dihydroneopterin aldolase [Gammaproteobacteria bacterium]